MKMAGSFYKKPKTPPENPREVSNSREHCDPSIKPTKRLQNLKLVMHKGDLSDHKAGGPSLLSGTRIMTGEKELQF